MEQLNGIVQQILGMQWSDYLDVIVVTFLIYKLLPLLKSSGTAKIARVVAVIIVVSWLTETLSLHTMSFIFNQVLAIGLIALIVLYQPELRRVLDRLGSVKFTSLFSGMRKESDMMPVIRQTVNACSTMSHQHVGALIVFARNNGLDEYFKSGTMLDANVSEKLIRNIFFVNSPLHDGAMVIRDGRIAAAGCVLPLSDMDLRNSDVGTRHRAAVGMSEASDAVVVVVSEETGTISLAEGGVIRRYLAPQTLEQLLCKYFCPEENAVDEGLVNKLYQKLRKHNKEEDQNEE